MDMDELNVLDLLYQRERECDCYRIERLGCKITRQVILQVWKIFVRLAGQGFHRDKHIQPFLILAAALHDLHPRLEEAHRQDRLHWSGQVGIGRVRQAKPAQLAWEWWEFAPCCSLSAY